jgi:GH15 family glucan-1,4-alpha-glucosidase
MALRIEDYAIIGDTHTAALVGLDGSIDWLCLPHFDSAAVFAGLLGNDSHGHWKIAPHDVAIHSSSRRYRGDTLVLETEFATATGVARIVDAMMPTQDQHVVLRLVEGISGHVSMRSTLRMRFEYGSVVPWVRTVRGETCAIAGPDALTLRGDVKHDGRDMATVADFEIRNGESLTFQLLYHRSHRPAAPTLDVRAEIDRVEAWWATWMSGFNYDGRWQDAVRRSVITLKGLTYASTGGIVAAATTSLPEQLGGVRNWDYRFCWLRDATITLIALIDSGFVSEAKAWREWLLRAIAGDPSKLQIMYGVGGERRLAEWEVPWLPGYQGAAPVRIGNAAVQQFQLDVYGEVMDALHVARQTQRDVAAREGRTHKDPVEDISWALQRKLMDFLETGWAQPDEGIWEVRGPRRHFVHSKVMAWVAADRAARAITDQGMHGPLVRYQTLRDKIRDDVLANGFDAERQTFTQYYGSRELDAALLNIPLVGFLPGSDPRVQGTVRAIEKELLSDGFVRRYTTTEDVDGLPPGEGAFLACTFWLADNYAAVGRLDESVELFERLLSLRNDVGLLAEEWDPIAQRMTGNFPQAFSHVPLVYTARNLSHALEGRAEHKGRSGTRYATPVPGAGKEAAVPDLSSDEDLAPTSGDAGAVSPS